MKSKLVMLFLLLVLNFNLIATLFSDGIKYHTVVNTESYNYNITQDKDGMLWISTEGNKGLLSYNGN